MLTLSYKTVNYNIGQNYLAYVSDTMWKQVLSHYCSVPEQKEYKTFYYENRCYGNKLKN